MFGILFASTGLKVDSNDGTLAASVGAFERVLSPEWLDIVSPFFAFCMVILLPSCIAMWVIYRTIKDKELREDER